jgi:type I restriction enzyme, S subunit
MRASTSIVNGSGTWRRYPVYRTAELPWLPQMPTDWTIQPVWTLFSLGRGRVISNVDIQEHEGPYPVFSSQTENDGILGTIDTYDFDGDYLTWTTDGAKAGTVFSRNGRFNCTNVCGTLKPKTTSTQIRFFYYALNIATSWFVRHDINPKLMNNTMAKIRLPVPSCDEQCQIVTFLDRETAKINALIAKKERLIELLHEKRTALISQAVTRGFDPNVSMKDSGLDWLGSIPQSWSIARNKVLFREIDDRSVTADEELLTVSHITGVTPRSEKPDVTMFLAETLEGYKKCDAGDVVVNTMWAFMGALGTAFVPGVVSPSYNVYRLRDKCRLDPAFLDLLYRTPLYKAQVLRYSKGIWHSRLRLYPEAFFEIVTVVPSLLEQRRIVEYVGRIAAEEDRQLTLLRGSIDKLLEYRTALISAAVTGKIDVREEVEP